MKYFWILAVKRVVFVATVLLLAACASQDRHTPTTPPADGDTVAKKQVTIALLGATGMVGGYIMQHALEQGYDIRALARTPQKLDHLKDRITVVLGDARDPAAIERLLQGSQIVVSALGPVKADGNAAKMISTTATGLVIGLMPKYDIRRYLLVSGAAVTIPGDDRNLTGWLMQKMVAVGLRDVLADKQAEYQLLEDSNVQWTLVRCPLIKAEPFEQAPLASLETPTSFNLRAGELARFLIEQIESDEFIRRGPFLVSQ